MKKTMIGVPDSYTVRRFNPLTGEWVLVSEGRRSRPWGGQVESGPTFDGLSKYDESCPLCPGNTRAAGVQNPDYKGVFVFDNDFPALGRDAPKDAYAKSDETGFFVEKFETGICRVFCFSHEHNMTLSRMATSDIRSVISQLSEQTELLSVEPSIQHVQIFENRGESMGCSSPHPHGQIWAQSSTPTIVQRELHQMEAYFASHRSSMLGDYVAEELRRKERVVCENEAFAALVPYWAAWPFETIVIPRRTIGSMVDLRGDEARLFAEIIGSLTIRYDNLFQTDFPYTSGIHQHPVGGDTYRGFHMHMHFYPPLLRSAEIRKFMVGYEMLAEPQRDLSPEEAAGRLRDLSDVHFRRAS